jgi:hypothetical protein
MRTRLVSILALLLLPVSAFAHMHKAGAYLAYAGQQGSWLNGLEMSAEVVVSDPLCKPQGSAPPDCARWFKPSFSVFADVGAGWGEHNGGERTQAALMGGLRMTFSHHVLQPFVHAALAGVRTQDSEPNAADTSLGFDLGGGVSVGFEAREKKIWKYLRLRAQTDYTWLSGSDRLADHYFRFSIGVEVRFARPAK